MDLSAAFDTIDHTITTILRGAVNLSVSAVPRLQLLLCASTGVPQGSVLGPMLFSLFISPIAHIASSYGLLQQQYADDTQKYVAISKDNYDTPVAKLKLCLSTLHTWFCYNGLALNPDKSEAIVFGTTQRSRSLPITSTVNVAGTIVRVSNQVRILGVTLDSRLSFDAHISALSKSCFYHIRALNHIRTNLTLDCSKNIACSLVASITPTRPSWGYRLRTFLGFNVCKVRSLTLSHVNGDASASPRLCRSFIGFLSCGG